MFFDFLYLNMRAKWELVASYVIKSSAWSLFIFADVFSAFRSFSVLCKPGRCPDLPRYMNNKAERAILSKLDKNNSEDASLGRPSASLVPYHERGKFELPKIKTFLPNLCCTFSSSLYLRYQIRYQTIACIETAAAVIPYCYVVAVAYAKSDEILST